MDEVGSGNKIMKTRETTNDSQTLAQHGTDRFSPLPAEFGALYQDGYDAGFASGKEAGYRQGYQAGFTDGRGQGDGSTAAPAAVENNAIGIRKARLLGLPCSRCGRWFFSDEARCPRCQTPRVSIAEESQPIRSD
jgi:hypothetical protein